MHVCLCMCICVLVCVHMRMYGCVYIVLCHLCGVSQNIEFHGHVIPGAVSVACGAIPDDNADVKSLLFRAFAYHLHIGILYS